ncbi:MAG: ABC transporter ATP-binding protein [Nitrososphaeria archaeon]
MVIETRNLYHVYPGNVQALQDVNIKINVGEFTAIVGQNGSGKTTLALHLNGLLKPTKGDVFIKGKNTRNSDVEELSKVVGYVYQNPNHQLFNLTVKQELAFSLKRLLSKEETEKRLKETVELFGIQDILDSNPFSLSLPVKKIVAMAAIHAMRPEIFVLDEPTTGQDFVGMKLIEKAILNVSREGKTIIVITHDMGFVARHAKRVIVMAEGKVIGDDEPKKIFDLSNNGAKRVIREARINPPHTSLLSYALRFDYNLQNFPTDIITPTQFADVVSSNKLRGW